MKKFLFTALMATAITGSGFAQSSSINYSYAEDNAEIGSYGVSVVQRYDVAMMLSNPGLAGAKITKIYAYITSPDVIKGSTETGKASLWLSTELGVQFDSDGKNTGQVITNILKEDITPQKSTYAGYTIGLISLTLDNPYEYDGGDLYIGYSIDIPDIATNEQKYPLVLADGINDNGFWLHGTKNPLSWRDYSSKTEGVALIFVELEGNFPASSLSLNSISESNAAKDKAFEVTANVTNNGSAVVNSVAYTYTIAGNTYNNQVTLSNPVKNNPASVSRIKLPIDPLSEVGVYELNLTITDVNGSPNQSVANTATGEVRVLPFEIVNRPLLEEVTNLGCGYCPRGFTALELLNEEYGDDIVLMSYHNTWQGPDDMVVTNNMPFSAGGNPSASINRSGSLDPYYGNTNQNMGIAQDIEKAREKSPICDLNVTDLSVNGNELTVTVDYTFTQNISNANYKFGYALTGNGLSNPNWKQSNYYANELSLLNTPLAGWVTAGGSVYGLVFNDVVVNPGAYMGLSGVIPSDIEFGKPYSYQFSLQCQDLKNIYGNVLPFDLSKAVINVFIIDGRTGQIVNANKMPISKTGIESINIDNEAGVVETVYYDLNGRVIKNPTNGIFVKVNKLSDGTTRTSKIAIK